ISCCRSMRWCRARMPRPRSRSRRCSRSCPIDSTSSWRSSGTSRRPRSPRSTGCCATSTSRQWGREAGSGENRTGEGRRERYVTLVVIALAAALLAGGDALSEGELRREQSVSLAHTLADLPGINALTTGQQIGKPIIRGLTGPRVLVLEDGSRLEDYSWSDEDGPSIDARLAQRVEVIRG